jgi:hypothetical protein
MGSIKPRTTGTQALLDRVNAMTADQVQAALTYLAAHHPGVFDAALDMAELFEDGVTVPGTEAEWEPYCAACGSLVGVFAAQGDDWMHYRIAEDGRPEPYAESHAPVVGWRLAVLAPAG